MGHGWKREEGQGNEGERVWGEMGLVCVVVWVGRVWALECAGERDTFVFVLGPLSKS